jgi:HD superfamily phosphodiesterase
VHVLAAHGEIISTRTLCPAGRNPEWEQLRDHLRLVTETCARFAGTFGWAELARVAGLLHDTENAPKSVSGLYRAVAAYFGELYFSKGADGLHRQEAA